jgi:hypothetical protein
MQMKRCPRCKGRCCGFAGFSGGEYAGKVEAWIRSFNGNKLIVSDEAAGVFWMNDFEQAADSAKSMAEGQELRPQSSKRTTSIWTYVAYVFAGLFACQLLFMLLLFGVSMVAGF